jgi:hypothetical protein
MMFVYDSLGSISKIRINQQEFPSRLIEIYTNLVTILARISKFVINENDSPNIEMIMYYISRMILAYR